MTKKPTHLNEREFDKQIMDLLCAKFIFKPKNLPILDVWSNKTHNWCWGLVFLKD